MTCTICRAQTADGVHLCRRHRDELLETIDAIPDTLADAETTIARQDRTGTGGGGTPRRPAEGPAPINITASDRARQLREAVTMWARWTLEHDNADLAGVEPVAYLRMSVDLIAGHEWAAELYADLSATRYRLVHAIDRAPDWITLGQCGLDMEGQPCPGTIKGIRTQTPRGTTEVHNARCQTCRTHHDGQQIQQDRAADAYEHFETLAVVVNSLNQAGFKINLKSAQRWVEQGNLKVLRYRDKTALFTPGQVIAAQAEMQHRRGRPRRAA